jgi:hypothetical protein
MDRILKKSDQGLGLLSQLSILYLTIQTMSDLDKKQLSEQMDGRPLGEVGPLVKKSLFLYKERKKESLPLYAELFPSQGYEIFSAESEKHY